MLSRLWQPGGPEDFVAVQLPESGAGLAGHHVFRPVGEGDFEQVFIGDEQEQGIQHPKIHEAICFESLKRPAECIPLQTAGIDEGGPQLAFCAPLRTGGAELADGQIGEGNNEVEIHGIKPVLSVGE